MKKSDWKEIVDKTGKWLGTHKKPAVLTCLATAAVAAAAGVILCALRSAPLPTDTAAAAQRAISIAVSEKTDSEPEASSRFAAGSEASSASSSGAERAFSDHSGTETSSGNIDGTERKQDKTQKQESHEKTKPPAESAGSTGSGTEESRPRTVKAEEVTGTEQPSRQEDKKTENTENTVPQHEHNWVPVTVTVHRDAVTHTVHHDAETEIVHHDPVTHEEPVYEYRTICNTCGEDITGQIPDHIGPVCQGSYSMQQVQTGVNIVTDTEAFDEEVVVRNAWDETVVDQEARDETVTAGWRCSVCGQMKD